MEPKIELNLHGITWKFWETKNSPRKNGDVFNQDFPFTVGMNAAPGSACVYNRESLTKLRDTLTNIIDNW